MGLFNRRRVGGLDRTPTNIVTAEAVRRQWPLASLDRQRALDEHREGVRRFAQDGYAAETDAAKLLAHAAAYSLYGPGLLSAAELTETVRKILYGSMSIPPDGRSFPKAVERCTLLALQLTRERRWQPARWGGAGLFDPVILEPRNRMILGLVVGNSPADLERFFMSPS